MNPRMNLSQFKIGNLNVRSILPSLTELSAFIIQNNFDIFTITETWLNDRVLDDDLYINGYKIYRHDRVSNRGGGVCIYAKVELTISVLPCDRNIEQLWISVRFQNEMIGLGVTYRSPKYDIQSFIAVLEDTIGSIFPSVNRLICTGDFNMNVLDLHASNTHSLFSLLDTFGLYQIIDAPTRVTHNTFSLIDLILVDNADSVQDCGVIECDLSDHYAVFCTIGVNRTIHMPRFHRYRNFKHFNMQAFECNLRSIGWEQIYEIKNVDDKLEFLVEHIVNLFDFHAPFITSRFSKPHSPWITDTIKVMMSIRDNALKRHKRSKLDAHWTFYKEMRNLTTSAIKREKKAYFEFKLKNLSPRNSWNFLRENNVIPRSKKHEIPLSLRNPNGLNNFFVNSIPTTNTSPTLLNHYMGASISHNNNFEFELVSEQAVYEVLRDIKSNSVGCDGLSIHLIHLCCPYIVPYITHVINFCLINSVFPNMWKSAVVKVLPKVSKPEEFKDLRAISILPVLSKVMERIMERQLREYLHRYNIIPTVQSGFRSAHSCTTALLHITDDIISATDQGLYTVLVLLDFSRAFDTLNHELLIAILRNIGLSVKTVALFKSYLCERTQKVRVDNDTSDPILLKSGVPQGSILGPVLFIIYSSFLANRIQCCKAHFYADDTQLYYSFKGDLVNEASDLINRDLHQFISSANDHSLYINAKKSKIVVFGPKMLKDRVKTKLNIVVGHNKLEVVDKVKNLGIMIDSELKFEEHINALLRKAYLSLKQLYGSRHYLPQKVKIILCESLVLTLFNYADSVYGPCLNVLYKRKVQKLQNSCLRFIYGIRKNKNISHKLKETKWLNMQNRRLHHAACLFHSLILKKTPEYLYNKIKFRTDVHTLNIRFRGLLTPPLRRTEFFKRSFSYQIFQLYNNVNDRLKTLNARLFRKKYKTYLLETQTHIN